MKDDIRAWFRRVRGRLPSGVRFWLTSTGDARCLERDRAELDRELKRLRRNIRRRVCRQEQTER